MAVSPYQVNRLSWQNCRGSPPLSSPNLLQGCCSEAEAQQTGRRQTPPQPMQCELPTVPVQIGSHFLKGVSFNESAADNLKLKTVAFHGVPIPGVNLETVLKGNLRAGIDSKTKLKSRQEALVNWCLKADYDDLF